MRFQSVSIYVCVLAVSTIVSVIGGCGEKATQPEAIGYGAAKFAVPIPKRLVNTLTRVESLVTAADIDTIRKDLTIEADNVARGVITGILVGDNRKVTLNGYNSSGVLTHSGYKDGLTITVRDTLSVDIVLLPITGAVSVNGIIGQMDEESPDIEGIEFVLVPGGEFQMGDLWEDGRSDQRPVHTVRVDDFWMGKYEVTVGQFRRFVEATGYRSVAEKDGWSFGWPDRKGRWIHMTGISWRDPGFPQDDSHPVVCVNWYDAVPFCNWLSSQAGLEKVYDESTWEADFSKVAYRLPTEAECEYAIRAGGKEIKYSNGNTLTHDDANYDGIGGRDRWDGTSPVGSFPPNELGLYDMTGNVWEMCNDRYDSNYYSRSPENNPTGPSPLTPGDRVHRGGSWIYGPEYCRSTYRGMRGGTAYDGGFRIVLPVR